MTAVPASPLALVTGAASGIGRAIAGRLAQTPGARVVVLDRDAEGAERAAHEIRASGGQARAAVIDLARSDEVATALPALCGDWGPPDVLVNNAGIVATVPAIAVTLGQWHGTLAVNLTAPMLLIQQALPHMLAQRWGRVVNIASISGVRAGTGRLAYGTSKAALIAMTQQFAIEVAEAGVTVNAVAPGPIETPLVRQLLAPGTQSAYAEKVPMRRFGTPEDIADAVAYLASPGAGYVTGHTLAVDGGFLASGVFVRHLFDPPTPD